MSQYSVEFHKMGEGSQLVDMVSGETSATPWHTINDPDGVNLRNMANIVIRAIRIKAKRDGDTFLVPKNPANDVFQTIWKRKNNTEVAFLDGEVALGTIIWNRVNDTIPGQPTTSFKFEGQIYNNNFPIGDPQNWELVHSRFSPGLPEDWKRLLLRMPSHIGAIECYANVDGNNQVVLVARGYPYLFDFASRQLHALIISKLIPRRINRVTVEGKTVELWCDGASVATIDLARKESYGLQFGTFSDEN